MMDKAIQKKQDEEAKERNRKEREEKRERLKLEKEKKAEERKMKALARDKEKAEMKQKQEEKRIQRQEHFLEKYSLLEVQVGVRKEMMVPLHRSLQMITAAVFALASMKMI